MIESNAHLQVEYKRTIPDSSHPGYRVVSICPQVKPEAGTIAAFVRRNFPVIDGEHLALWKADVRSAKDWGK